MLRQEMPPVRNQAFAGVNYVALPREREAKCLEETEQDPWEWAR